MYVVSLTTAQHTYIDDDNYDLSCEDTFCGRHLQTQVGRVQNELQQQRQQIEELTKAVNRISKSDKAG